MTCRIGINVFGLLVRLVLRRARTLPDRVISVVGPRFAMGKPYEGHGSLPGT